MDPTEDCQLSTLPAVGEGVLQLHSVAHYNAHRCAHHSGCSETREDVHMGMGTHGRLPGPANLNWDFKLQVQLGWQMGALPQGEAAGEHPFFCVLAALQGKGESLPLRLERPHIFNFLI